MPDPVPEIRFELNGETVDLPLPEPCSALELLRDELGITSLKAGCAPQGACGCCTALVDGRPRLTCTMKAERLHGRRVRTLEGTGDPLVTLLAQAFSEEGGFQCGFCTPGILLRSKALLDSDPAPDEETIRRALAPHICRCTGWQGVVRSIERAAAWLAADKQPSPAPDHDLPLGRRAFIGDIQLPGMLHGALVFSPHPRCRVIEIDVSRALAMPGVHAVATASDFPGRMRAVGLIDPDWPPLVAVGEETSYVGDVLAAVAADSARLARRAAAAVRLRVEPLPAQLDAQRASQDPANILGSTRIQSGDVDGALAEAAAVVSETFRTSFVDQAFLEPEAALARPLADKGLHLLSCGQGIFDDRRQLCQLFDLPPERVVVEHGGMGGGFGGREDLSVQAHACLLAQLTGRPVRVVLNMAESIRMHPKRHPMVLRFTLAADQRGRLTALRARILGDGGGHASVSAKVLGRAASLAGGPYAIPNVDVQALAVRTNNPVCGAMRGFGANQAAWAIEGCVERLCQQLGLDPLRMRLRNALRPGDTMITGQRMGAGVGIVRTLQAIQPHYERARAAGRPAGLACAIKNTGLGTGFDERGRIVLRVEAPDAISIRTGFSEMGQGHARALRRMAARATGLPIEFFRVRTDTREPVDVGMTTASRATALAGRALQDAAQALLRALEGSTKLEALIGRRFRGAYQAPATQAAGQEGELPTHWAYSYATQLAILNEQGELEEVVAAHDVGHVIDATACRGQIEGGVHMGIGYALTESLQVRDGWPDLRYARHGVIRAHRSPRVTCLLVEVPDPHGPWGAKGLGEIVTVPTAPAIAAAIQRFDGRWRQDLPMPDTPAARALGARAR